MSKEMGEGLSKPGHDSAKESNPLSPTTFGRMLGELARYNQRGKKITASESVRHDEAVKEGLSEERIVGGKREIIITDKVSGVTKDIFTETLNEAASAARKISDGSYPLGRVSAIFWDGPSQKSHLIASFGLQFTDSGKVTYAIDAKKGKEEVINNVVEKEVKEWGLPIELKNKVNSQMGLLDEGGGHRFIAALRKLDKEATLHPPSETEK